MSNKRMTFNLSDLRKTDLAYSELSDLTQMKFNRAW
jgi:hypothetical protein